MNDDNKQRMEEIKNVLLLAGLIILAILSSVGCFNYATLANKAGDPDNLFWLVGLVNIIYNGFAIYKIGKKFFPPREIKK